MWLYKAGWFPVVENLTFPFITTISLDQLVIVKVNVTLYFYALGIVVI